MCILAIYVRCNIKASSPMIFQVKIDTICGYHIYISVYSTIKSKICLLWINIIIWRIIHIYFQYIIFFKFICYIYTESRISAIMPANFFAIYYNFSRRIHSPKFYIGFPLFLQFRPCKLFSV